MRIVSRASNMRASSVVSSIGWFRAFSERLLRSEDALSASNAARMPALPAMRVVPAAASSAAHMCATATAFARYTLSAEVCFSIKVRFSCASGLSCMSGAQAMIVAVNDFVVMSSLPPTGASNPLFGNDACKSVWPGGSYQPLPRPLLFRQLKGVAAAQLFQLQL